MILNPSHKKVGIIIIATFIIFYILLSVILILNKNDSTATLQCNNISKTYCGAFILSCKNSAGMCSCYGGPGGRIIGHADCGCSSCKSR